MRRSVTLNRTDVGADIEIGSGAGERQGASRFMLQARQMCEGCKAARYSLGVTQTLKERQTLC
jgi:hypothetical protein